jgi:spermidine synthase
MGFITLSTTHTLSFALLVMGFTATASQILIIRELLVTFHGNELFIGIIFGNWLILEAIGSFALRKRADYTKRHISWFAILQITIGFSSLLSILFIRSFKYLFNIPTGEVLGIHYVAAISLITLAPVSMTDGALFPFGCRNFQIISEKKVVSATVYLYESIGSFVAGLFFVFYLIYYLSSVELAFIILALNLCSVIFYLISLRKIKTIRNVAALLMASIIISFLSSVPEWLHELSSRLLWYEHSLLDTRNSVYSNIAVIKGEDQYTFFANGAPYAATPVPTAHVEEIAHFPMLFHKQPEHILVVGGGAGGLLRELLKHPVKDIDYTEQDPLVIEGFRRFPTPLTEYELDHEKVNMHLLEGRLFLRKTSAMYDLILINLPIPSTIQINRYYTMEFFELAKKRLKDRGIFAMRLPGSDTFLSKELKELNRTIHASLKAVFPHVRIIAGEQNIFIASSDIAVKTIMDETLIERLHLRDISAGLINERYLRYKMDSARFGELEKDISSSEEKIINQDSYPRGVFEGMLFLNLVVSPFMVKILYAIGNIPYTHYLLLIIILFIVSLIILSKKRDFFLIFAIASTGFTSMLISILLILSFQIYYGYVYHYIGLLTSLFMIGSALGAFFAMKRIKISLMAGEIGISFLAGFLYLFLLLSPEAVTSQLILFGSMITIGFLTGMEYPLAVNLADSSYRAVSSTAGRFYAFDLLGAFIGAILTAVVFIPTIGIKNTLLITMAIKSVSLFLVYRGKRAFV